VLYDLILQPLLSHWRLVAFAGVILIGLRILRAPAVKGWIGEWHVNRGLRKLDGGQYQLFHDLYLPRPDGKGTTQVDHVVVSPFGVFVVETKNYRGWIFGTETQRQWTQQIFRRKEKFQNPLHQNKLHVRALMELLRLPESAVRPVVIFIGDAVFKTKMPENVLSRGLGRWIGKHQEVLLDADEVQRVSAALAAHDRATDREVVARQHVRDLIQRGEKVGK